ENLKYILDELAECLTVANRAIMDPEDYDLNKYEDLKLMYDMIIQKGQLSASESQAFIEELRSVRKARSEEHTSELQSRFDLVCRLLLEKKKKIKNTIIK